MSLNKRSFDVLVVGGGLIGAATVHELRKSDLRIAWIYSRRLLKQAASAAAGAMLGAYAEISLPTDCAQDSEEFMFRLTAQKLYSDWLSDIEDATGRGIFTSNGTFVVGNSAGPGDRAVLSNIMKHSEEHGGQAEWVTPAEVPGLKTASRYEPIGCIHLPFENSVSSKDISEALQASASACPSITVIDDEIREVVESGGEMIATGSEGSYRGAKIVIAAGSRSLSILSEELTRGLSIPSLYFGKGVSTLVQSSEPIFNTIRTPNRAFACGAHVVPRENGRLYLGATNFFGTDHMSESSIEVGELHILFDQAIHQINTELRRAKIIDSRFGFRPITTSRNPMVGQTVNPRVFIGTGTYRNGVLMAPLIAKIISYEVTGRDPEYANPYQPKYGDANFGTPDIEKIVSSGIEDIVGILHEPNGILPYGRTEELSKFLSVIFRLALVDEDSSGVRRKMNAMLREIPLNETMNRIYYEVLLGDNTLTPEVERSEVGK